MRAEDVAALCEAVGEAVQRYEHHGHEAVLRAMLALSPRPMPGAYAALMDAEHAATGPMRRLLAGAGSGGFGVRRALVAMLALPTCAPATVAALRRCVAEGTLDEALVGQEHLLEQEAVREGLSIPGATGGVGGNDLLPDAAHRGGWTEDARRAWVHWVAALPLEGERRVALWAEALADPALSVRVAAAMRLMAHVEAAEAAGGGDPDTVAAARDAVAGLAGDGVEEVARLAVTWTMARRPVPSVRRVAQLAREAGDRAGRGAALRLAPLAFDGLWEAWPGLAERDRSAAVAAVVKLDADARQRLVATAGQPGGFSSRARQMLAHLPADVHRRDTPAAEAA